MSDMARQLRNLFEATKQNTVLDFGLLLEAADELDHLTEELDAAHEDGALLDAMNYENVLS